MGDKQTLGDQSDTKSLIEVTISVIDKLDELGLLVRDGES